MTQVEGGRIIQHSGSDKTIIAVTTSGESAGFATINAARHWLAMDHEITESRAYRAGLRGEGA